MPYTALHPTPSDEGFLNKSLLDQLDAQADAEPVSSSASDDSSHGSPHVPYHAPNHVQDTTTHDYQPQPPKMASFYPRASFTAFPNATRRQPYREPPSATAPQFYPAATAAVEPFAPQLTSPVLQPFDPRASFDFKAASSYPPPQADYPPPQQSKLNGYAAPYVNGMHSQTPYGPHVPAMGPLNGAGAGLPPPAMLGSMQEDISTIFVVGFPEDMQEREFQNMFTFSPGFEAATLKIPNKEYTAYSGVLLPNTYPGQQQQQRALGGAGQYNSYAGSHDPYNLVTVNQGGVVVDAGRDGIASWPAAPPLPASSSGQPPTANSTAGDEPTQQASQHQQGYGGAAGGAAPRKQIIGFAKFRTREEALGARDVLQGRRVDIERGAVLKAEMAKKNLHTKRGVGPVGGGGGGGMNMNGGMGYSEALSPREMGLPPAHAQAQSHPGAGLAGLTNGHGMTANANSNGARMAAQWRESQVQMEEEDERDRERERERRQAGVLSAMGLRGERRQPPQQRAFADAPGPWDAVRRRSPSPDAGGYEAAPGHGYDGYAFAEAPRAFSSPPPHAHHNFGYAAGAGYAPFMGAPTHHEAYSLQQQHEHEQQYHRQAQEYHNEQYEAPRRQERSESSASEGSAAGELERGMVRLVVRNESSGHGPGTPSSNGNTNSAGTPANNSPPAGNAVSNPNAPITIPGSGTGSAGGSGSGGGSPQLASPASSGAGRAVDQNPPINTLYVGNLPVLGASAGVGSSSTPTMEHLEGALRELFGACAGFRQMSFRPKGNGPMCFVEFEDVGYATKTLNELYGHTLGGLIKGGGIRLSYSKNPLGVRTPTSAGGGSMREQQMQGAQQGMNVQQQQQGMSLQQNLQQQQMLAEAAFHPRLTSPPPPPEGAVTAPRFFGEGGGAWGRRWESEHRGARGSVSANGAGFAPFVPEQAEAQ